MAFTWSRKAFMKTVLKCPSDTTRELFEACGGCIASASLRKASRHDQRTPSVTSGCSGLTSNAGLETCG